MKGNLRRASAVDSTWLLHVSLHLCPLGFVTLNIDRILRGLHSILSCSILLTRSTYVLLRVYIYIVYAYVSYRAGLDLLGLDLLTRSTTSSTLYFVAT